MGTQACRSKVIISVSTPSLEPLRVDRTSRRPMEGIPRTTWSDPRWPWPLHLRLRTVHAALYLGRAYHLSEIHPTLAQATTRALRPFGWRAQGKPCFPRLLDAGLRLHLPGFVCESCLIHSRFVGSMNPIRARTVFLDGLDPVGVEPYHPASSVADPWLAVGHCPWWVCQGHPSPVPIRKHTTMAAMALKRQRFCCWKGSGGWVTRQCAKPEHHTIRTRGGGDFLTPKAVSLA